MDSEDVFINYLERYFQTLGFGYISMSLVNMDRYAALKRIIHHGCGLP